MEQRIQNDLMAAMKAGDELRAKTLRSVKAAILNEKSTGTHHELTNDDIIKIINKQIKLREDAASIYNSSERTDLGNREMAEREILLEYVPKKLNLQETKAAIESAISETGISSTKEKGKIFGFLKKKYGETIEMSLVSMAINDYLQ